MTENEISKIVFESALKVHKVLGPGLLESASFDLWISETGCWVQNWYDYWG